MGQKEEQTVMKTSEEILKRINDEFLKGNKEIADRIYNDEYLPLIYKENQKMRKEMKNAF